TVELPRDEGIRGGAFLEPHVGRVAVRGLEDEVPYTGLELRSLGEVRDANPLPARPEHAPPRHAVHVGGHLDDVARDELAEVELERFVHRTVHPQLEVVATGR